MHGGRPRVAVVTGAGRVRPRLLREQAGEEESAIIWTAPRILSPEEVADRTVALLDSKRLVEVIPRRRAWQVRALALAPCAAVRASWLFRLGERRRASEQLRDKL